MDQILYLTGRAAYDKRMKMLLNYLDPVLSRPAVAGAVLAGLSAAALAMAFIAEQVFRLDPCILCLYQRVPYALAIMLGLMTVWIYFMVPRASAWTLSMLGLTFSANSIIAFYHTGVERGWWKSFLEGCAVPALEGNITDVLAQIEARTDAPRCDEIPWADPVLGLSMANYNVVLCIALAALAFGAMVRAAKRPE